MSQTVTLAADLTVTTKVRNGEVRITIPSGTVITFPDAVATDSFHTSLDAAADFLAQLSRGALLANLAQFTRQVVISGVAYNLTYGADGQATYTNVGAPPTIASAEVGVVDATHLILHTSENINSVNTDYKTGWTLKYGGVAKTITSVARDGTDKTKLTFVLAVPVTNADVVTLDYSLTTGNLKSDSGASLQTQTGVAVTNTVP
jgi:hypothetical protein